MIDQTAAPDGAGAPARAGRGDASRGAGRFSVECRAADGRLRWVEDTPNLITTAGKQAMVDTFFRAAGYTAALYLGLKGPGPGAASDTMASHPGWAEVAAHTAALRPALVTAPAAANTAGAVEATNQAGAPTFTIAGAADDAVVAGCIVTTGNTVGGTAGLLFAVSDFRLPRPVMNGDTLRVVYTFTQT